MLFLINVQYFDPFPYYSTVHSIGTTCPVSSSLKHDAIKYGVVNHFITGKNG
jgi:hypothetical protein